MNATVYPAIINSTLIAPASKSSMQRACAAALLKKGDTIILNYGKSNDDKAALSIIKSFGAEVHYDADFLKIKSQGISSFSNQINCGESGLSIRMFTPIAALANKEIEIVGNGSLTTRPMDFFDEVLPKLGVNIKSHSGKLPLLVKGPLIPTTITVDGSLSSQFLTGLLMAYAAADATDVTINVTNLKSKPYIDLTLEVMRSFGLKIPKNENYEKFYFTKDAHPIPKETTNYTVEGDWSGGAFLLVAGAIAGKICVKGLQLHSAQADKAILNAIKDCGAKISLSDNDIVVETTSLKAFQFDATECPDLFPPLVALASFCNGTTTIKGVSRLIHKESNRGETLKQEFAKLGVSILLEDDFMHINGIQEAKSCSVSSHHDHRIAMACAIAALRANDKVDIEHANAINKSYPDFFSDLKRMNVKVSY
jgi:3-phosphoshikimate 1-carboxyvinyltransferase